MSGLSNSGLMRASRLWNRVARTYADDIEPELAKYSEDALLLARVEPGMRVADVACGPGHLSLCAARLGARVCAVDFSLEMTRRLRDRVRLAEDLPVCAQVGNGMALPLASDSFDRAFSLFGLMFFPDRGLGLGEMLRILKPDGTAVVGSWVPFAHVPQLDDIYSTLASLHPGLHFNGCQAPLGTVEAIKAEMTEAGFRHVEVKQVTHVREVASIDEYWRMIARSTPRVHAAREAVGEQKWPTLIAELLARLRIRWGSGSLRIAMTANLAVGRS